MKKIILLIIMLLGFSIYAQKITNVSNYQEQSSIIVSYDLETKTPCKIELYVSTNGGTTWQGPLKKVSGDVGANVSSGTKNITWLVLEEFEELRGNNIVFQVRAENISVEVVNKGNIIDTSIETVLICKQNWTKKNLDVSTYSDGTPIPEVTDPTQWDKLTTGAWCYYKNKSHFGTIYGKLYNWYAVAGIYDGISAANPAFRKKLAPAGFHVPSDAEWTELTNCLGGEAVAGPKMKNDEYLCWSFSSSEIKETNESGFTALPGGYRYDDVFTVIYYYGNWWSSTEYGFKAISRKLKHNSNSIFKENDNKIEGFSVRCIKD